VQLGLFVAALARAVAEDHVLQLALASLVADGAIEWMIGEEKFECGLARLRHLRRFRPNHHAFANRQRAACHQLRHFLHFHQAHATGGLQGEPFPVAERRYLDASALGGVDDQHAGRGFYRLAVDGELY
jgi:hypothetical protein